MWTELIKTEKTTYLERAKKTILALFLLWIVQIDAAGLSPYTSYMHISHDPKFIYFAVPKTGYTTIVDMLELNSNKNILIYGQIDIDDCENFFKFGFVRNPWDRVVSAYENLIVTKRYPPFEHLQNKDFDFFIDFISTQDLRYADIHIKLQTALLPEGLDFIGRFETFSNDLAKILPKLGLKDCEILYRNKSNHPHYSNYYNDRTFKIIAEKYKSDIEAFGYEFESMAFP